MNVLSFVLISAITFATLGCIASTNEIATPMRTIAKGNYSGLHEQQRQIITNALSWQEVWSKHTKDKDVSERVPEIDFTKEMVVVVALGKQRTGGHSVEIVSADEHDGKLRIEIKRKKPRPGSMTLQVISAPFHFVAIPRNTQQPEFIEVFSPNREGSSPK